MKCPACQCTLTAVTLSDVIVNVCRGGCAGIWFERGALRTFDEPAEGAGQTLLALAGDPHVSVDLTQRRRCPICPDSVMMRHFFSAKRAITVDECPTCGGVWLDSGELERIRAEYDSEGSRRLAARGGFEEILVADRMALFGRQLEEQLPYDTSRSRIAASILVVFHLLLAVNAGGAGALARWLGASIVPWACVCFPDAMSGHIGPVLGVSKTSPRAFVWFFGWLVLLLPEIQLAILWMEGVRPS